MDLFEDDFDCNGMRTDSEDPMWSGGLVRSPPPMLPSPTAFRTPDATSKPLTSMSPLFIGSRFQFPEIKASDHVRDASNGKLSSDKKTEKSDRQEHIPSSSPKVTSKESDQQERVPSSPPRVTSKESDQQERVPSSPPRVTSKESDQQEDSPSSPSSVTSKESDWQKDSPSSPSSVTSNESDWQEYVPSSPPRVKSKDVDSNSNSDGLDAETDQDRPSWPVPNYNHPDYEKCFNNSGYGYNGLRYLQKLERREKREKRRREELAKNNEGDAGDSELDIKKKRRS